MLLTLIICIEARGKLCLCDQLGATSNQSFSDLCRVPSCLPLDVSFQRIWICRVDFGSVLKFPLGSLGPVAPESPPCACSILNLGRYPCCANTPWCCPTAGKLLGAVLKFHTQCHYCKILYFTKSRHVWSLSSQVKDCSALHHSVAWTKRKPQSMAWRD